MDDHSSIGYAKPPRDSQFKKGKSGNPRGRPKGSLNPAMILSKALRETVVVQENGRRKRVSKFEVVMKQIANKAASGDPKAIQSLMNWFRVFEDQFAADAATRLAPTELHVHFLESDGEGRPKDPDTIETDENGNVIE